MLYVKVVIEIDPSQVLLEVFLTLEGKESFAKMMMMNEMHMWR